jgi:hypothetical protein
LLRLILVKNIHKPEESGSALARLIVDPALAATNGKYFEGMREIPSSVDSYDERRADELWRDSAILTALESLPEHALLGRLGRPEEMASDESSFCIGIKLLADGGITQL